MAVSNLTVNAANVTTPTGELKRHRATIRAGVLRVRDRRANEVLVATVTSVDKNRRGTYTIETDLGTIVISRAGCGCGGS